MVTQERVKQILESLDVIDPKVDFHDTFGTKFLVSVISPSFENMKDIQRQRMVWGKLLEELGDFESGRVEFVYTNSPSEMAALNAMRPEPGATP